MDPGVLTVLLVACVLLFMLEQTRVPTTLDLHFKGDIKRESRWLAQYGQSVCTPVAALLVWRLDPEPRLKPIIVIAGVLAASASCALLKRLLGRVRPGRENAGKFLGPTWKHANYRESFPSSHSACAVALSAVLASFYPNGAAIFWALAIICAALRYLLDAHWPSDVLGGSALGYGMAHAIIAAFGRAAM
ncbi:MAG TPA: phosphatase PAP2 family protein [Tepidisphaeraceae bacterium]|nr:phosphatase PAP2 family protein [Tepidisphaeraceae bacterium]